MRRYSVWIVLAVTLLFAVAIRFHALGRAAVRGDEINFLEQVAGGQTVVGLWANPPWLNQIPFADCIAVAWHWFRPGPPSERSVREPFALLGSVTVIGVAVWLGLRRSASAGVFAAVWMGLLPFHVYQSREAYYYIVAMACAAGMTLLTADTLARLRRGEPLTVKAYAAWTMWVVLTCLTHMSTWVVSLLCWVLMVAAGAIWLPAACRRRHVASMIVAGVVVALMMERWVWRAVAELDRVSGGVGHIGGEFAWVAPRVIPFFTVGANLYGAAASLMLLLAAGHALTANLRKPTAARDTLYEALTVITAGSFAALYAYVGAVGGGVAKIAYFSAVLPVFLAWSAYTLDLVAGGLSGRWPRIVRVALPCVAVMVLLKPAWMITQLDGKPVPYTKLRDWLDANLDPGSVAVVDRWLEPWNEMSRYAPGKVFVTFTVPDEPYETYRQLRWRDVTREFFEQGKGQAFIRLARNHESRDGVWQWPETHFARHAQVVNAAGLWLRDHGYAGHDDFYAANSRRLVIDIFYDRRADVVDRKRAAGEQFAVFFDQDMRCVKSGPMAMFPVQTEQFMDWRLLGQTGTVDVYNLGESAQRVQVRVRGVAPGGPKLVVGPNGQRFTFDGGHMREWMIGPLELQPGVNSIVMTDPGWASASSPLLVASIDVVTDGTVEP